MTPLRRTVRAVLDVLIGRLAQLLVLAFHRRIDVVNPERLRIDGPTLLVANHANGFVDPAVMAASLRRVPRFVAKSTLWNYVVARPFLALAGVIPVYRHSDGATAGNRSTFRAAHEVLASGGAVAIFPEGTSSDRPALEQIRTGAARMALGIVDQVPDITILPIGLSFESKVEIRPAVAVFVGEPIHVDAWRRGEGFAEAGEEDQEAVRALTIRVRDALTAVSPEFASLDERLILRAAATVAAREEGRRMWPPFGRVEQIARSLAGRPAPVRARVVDRYRDYATKLSLIGLQEYDLETRAELRQLARPGLSVAAVVFAGPLLLTLTLIHLPALLAVRISTSAMRSHVKKGTTRLLVGLVVGPATWITAGVVLADGWATVLAGAAVGIGGTVALALWLPLFTLARRVVGRFRMFDRRRLAEESIADRDRVMREVWEALGDRGAPPTARSARRPDGDDDIAP